MDEEIFKPLIRQALREALDDGLMHPGCCVSCELEPGEHAKHHEMLRNACSLRKQTLSALITSVVGGGLVWLGMAAWEKFFREVLK